MGRVVPEEAIVDEAGKIIAALKRKRPPSWVDRKIIEGVERLRDRLISLANEAR